jgi:hypothetical protein
VASSLVAFWVMSDTTAAGVEDSLCSIKENSCLLVWNGRQTTKSGLAMAPGARWLFQWGGVWGLFIGMVLAHQVPADLTDKLINTFIAVDSAAIQRKKDRRRIIHVSFSCPF